MQWFAKKLSTKSQQKQETQKLPSKRNSETDAPETSAPHRKSDFPFSLSFCTPVAVFLLVAAWVSPGRSALQSAEHWCQRRYSQIHLVMMLIIKMKQKRATRGHWSNKSNKTKQRSSQHCDFVAQLVKKRALVKSQRKAPTPEWEDACSSEWGGELWWNPVGKHLRQSGKVQCCKPSRRSKFV